MLIFLFSNFLKSFVQCNALQIKSKHKFGKYLHERFKKIRKLENKKIRKLAFVLWRLNLLFDTLPTDHKYNKEKKAC